ncbi:MAG: 3-dehydroquinate synthase [Phycisphaerae bacterium]|nr:3-dehydroquinate synthase [Phycisphaerae bacterium]
MTDTERTITIDLGKRSYDVRIGPGMIQRVAQAAQSLSARQAVVISETNVGPLYATKLLESLNAYGLDATAITFPAGEPNKTLPTAAKLLDVCLENTPPIDRDTLIIALGGGVAGDMAGFVAAVALRGLRWLQCPTSLLADVDASVGGKTGVDHPAGKNLIGAFHQPAGVLIDTETLHTLPLAELRNGLAECVKHAVIRDETLLDFLRQHSKTLLAVQSDDPAKLAFDGEVMVELIARNVAIKAAVVAADEREAGVRAHLNYGHTIGHAIETHIGYDNIRHGEAVSLGMVAVNHIAAARGMLDPAVADRVKETLAGLELPVAVGPNPLDTNEIWRIMQHDKKNRGGKVRMILPTALGSVDIHDDITSQEVQKAVAALVGEN